MKKFEAAGGVHTMHVRMPTDEHIKLKQTLIEDQLSFQDLATLFIQSYIRGDRIARLLIHGHRDARVAASSGSIKGSVFTQKDKDDIMRELEKGT